LQAGVLAGRRHLLGRHGQGAIAAVQRRLGDLPRHHRQWRGNHRPDGWHVTALFGLDFRGKAVVVAGGGTVATRRVRRMVDYGAHVTVVAPELSEDIARMASHGDITVVNRAIAQSDLDGVWFVVAATDDPSVNAQVAQWAEQQRVWCT